MRCGSDLSCVLYIYYLRIPGTNPTSADYTLLHQCSPSRGLVCLNVARKQRLLPLFLTLVRHWMVRVPERADALAQRAMRDRRHKSQPHRGVGRRRPVWQPRNVLGTGAGHTLRNKADPVVGESAWVWAGAVEFATLVAAGVSTRAPKAAAGRPVVAGLPLGSAEPPTAAKASLRRRRSRM